MKKTLVILLSLCVIPLLSLASFPVQKTNDLIELSIEEDAFMSSPTYERNVTFCWIGFVLGFMLNFVGIGIAYLVSKNYQLRRSSWYGLAALIFSGLFLFLMM
ncbi:MAG: hypothetical protein ISR00_05025 [Flavobacteriales bacterium]|nr:hypothetical protein [Flavobacteriales bacterium]MBL6873296.1 hypothetical protein [Flavobacteriales bacterium]